MLPKDNISDKIRSLAGLERVSLTELAKRIGMSKQNLNRKLKNNQFSEEDLKVICEALEADYEIVFINKDGLRI